MAVSSCWELWQLFLACTEGKRGKAGFSPAGEHGQWLETFPTHLQFPYSTSMVPKPFPCLQAMPDLLKSRGKHGFFSLIHKKKPQNLPKNPKLKPTKQKTLIKKKKKPSSILAAVF